MNYETVIGLEIHCELKTETKLFCGCRNAFGGKPNAHCCPGCTAHPGTLPLLNKKAVELTVRAGLALGCTISRYAQFERKNYFYPDLPKAYQNTQFYHPLCVGGGLSVSVNGNEKFIRLNRIHLEEDAGKLVHSETGDTMVDLNRGSVPLIEIVTEPDMRSPDEAIAFLEAVKSALKYTGVSDCRMEEGSLRCDVNISLMEAGSSKFGTRTEMKNINSFRAAQRAMAYEINRQKDMLSRGEAVVQETRRWDDVKNKSFPMRSKENAQDYRYVPDPDIVPVFLTEAEIESVRAGLPLLRQARKNKYIETYGLPEYDADVLTADKETADFFDACAALYPKYKTLSNWIMGDVMRKVKEAKSEDIVIALSPQQLVGLIKLYDTGEISQNASKTVFDILWQEGGDPADIVARLGLKQISDSGALMKMVRDVIAANPQPREQYKAGNKKAMAFFVGQIMKASQGKANPQEVSRLLEEELDK